MSDSYLPSVEYQDVYWKICKPAPVAEPGPKHEIANLDPQQFESVPVFYKKKKHKKTRKGG